MTEIILTSSILILLLAVLRRVLGGRIDPRVQYALWLLAAARLLIPGTLFTAPVSVMGAAEDIRISIREAYPDPSEEPSQPPAAEPAVRPVQPSPAVRPAGNPEAPVEIAPPAVPFSRWDFIDWPDAVWKAGMAAAGGMVAVSNLAFYLRLRRTRKRLDLPAAWSGKLPVYEVEGLSSPCLFGLFRPAVYLNRAAMDAEHPEHILAHEYAHYRHGDHLWSILRSICVAVHWYNPLVWWAAALSRRDCELACDASALRRLGEAERIDYGQTLLGMVSKGRDPAALLRTATSMSAGKRAMRERIALIVKAPRTRKLTLALAVLLACALAACSFGGREAKAPEGTEPSRGEAGGIPTAVTIYQAVSSDCYLTADITEPEEVEQLWEMYQSFEYEAPLDSPKEGSWPVAVFFYYGDTPGDDNIVFFIDKDEIAIRNGGYYRLKNSDEIYSELLRLSVDPDHSSYGYVYTMLTQPEG